jgi:Nucleotidyltransferase domain
LAEAYGERLQPRAILLVGSAATGGSDEYSDLDLIVYHDLAPPAALLEEIALDLGAEDYRGIPWSDESGEPDAAGHGERFHVGGVECQVAHISAGSFEREIRRLVVDLEIDEELLKIMSGLFEGAPLRGEEQIERWRETASYGEELQRAVIRKRWKFFPWWYYQERLRRRDATAWRHDVLVQSVYGIVGTLAALNGHHFSTFEFKRAGRFISRLEVAPPNLARRLDSLFTSPEPESTAELERLVEETRALVAARFPDLDLSIEWASTPADPGLREPPWSA